jgi:hypothetical protein
MDRVTDPDDPGLDLRSPIRRILDEIPEGPAREVALARLAREIAARPRGTRRHDDERTDA